MCAQRLGDEYLVDPGMHFRHMPTLRRAVGTSRDDPNEWSRFAEGHVGQLYPFHDCVAARGAATRPDLGEEREMLRYRSG
jgi:hypothetical protein